MGCEALIHVFSFSIWFFNGQHVIFNSAGFYLCSQISTPCSTLHPTVTHTCTCTAPVYCRDSVQFVCVSLCVIWCKILLGVLQRLFAVLWHIQGKAGAFKSKCTCAHTVTHKPLHIQYADPFKFQQFGFLNHLMCQYSLYLIWSIFLAGHESKADLRVALRNFIFWKSFLNSI